MAGYFWAQFSQEMSVIGSGDIGDLNLAGFLTCCKARVLTKGTQNPRLQSGSTVPRYGILQLAGPELSPVSRLAPKASGTRAMLEAGGFMASMGPLECVQGPSELHPVTKRGWEDT